MPPQNTSRKPDRIVNHIDLEAAKIDAPISKIREGIDKLKEYHTSLISAWGRGGIDR
jgi:hypothetical protein